MDITIKINCDNAAFEDNPGAELTRILAGLGVTFATSHSHLEPGIEWSLRDLNGNTCGLVEVR